GDVAEAGMGTDGDFLFQGNALINDGDANLGLNLGEFISINGVRTGTVGDGGDLTEVPGAISIQGTYGELLIFSSGTYQYTLDNTRPATEALVTGQSVDDVFTYQLVDAHGLTSLAEIVIHVAGADDLPPPPPVVAGDDSLLVTKGKASSIDARALVLNDTGV